MAVISAISAGVDISKATLDAAVHPGEERHRVANDHKGHQDLAAWLLARGVTLVVYEATGAYHHDFERALHKAGLALAKINPRRARLFAQALGTPAKTDALDAAMLASFGALLKPPARPPVSATLDEMKELHVARNGLIRDRTAQLNRQKTLRSAMLKRLTTRRITQIDSQITAIDAALKRLCGSDPELKARFDILLSIPGVGASTALAMLIEMPELGTLDPGQAARLAGVAPIARDSGAWQGKRSIGGGRAALRHALYMPALVACRFNPDLKAKYEALVGRGKPQKLAITAIMRKLIILANTLLKQGRAWQPNPTRERIA